MKFKLKIPNSGIDDVFITLQTENLNFGALKETVAAVLDNNLREKRIPFKLSLNGKDELEADNTALLNTDLRLVSGDIIRVLIENKYLEDQRAFILKMAQIKREAEEADCAQARTKDGKLINSYLNKPMLCHESTLQQIPELLRSEYENANVETRHDALVVAIHVLMLECGFKTTNFHWNEVKSSRGGVYRLNYTHTAKEFELTCTSLGKNIAVHGTILNENEDSTFHIDFNVDDFCDSQIKTFRSLKRAKNSTLPDPIGIFKNLPNLSQKFKDEFAHRMLRALPCDVSQRRSLACCTLLDLPYDCKMVLFGMLDFKSLCEVSKVCTNLYEAANEPRLWKNLMHCKFHNRAVELEAQAAKYNNKQQSDAQVCHIDWKKEYLLMEKERARNASRYMVPMHMFGHYPNRSYPPQRPDIFLGGGMGIIGGYHDLHPQLPSNPGYPRVGPRLPRQDLENPLIGPIRFEPRLPRLGPRGPRINWL